MKINDSVQFNGVYYLESQNANMNPIAIRPSLSPNDYASWEDTGHGRILHVAKVLINGQEYDGTEVSGTGSGGPKILPDRIDVIDDQGRVYKLVKLTKQIFNEKLKDFIAGGTKLNFQSDQELQNYFLKQNFSGYS